MQASYASYMPTIPTYSTYMYNYLVSHAYLISPYVMSLLYIYPVYMAQCNTVFL